MIEANNRCHGGQHRHLNHKMSLLLISDYLNAGPLRNSQDTTTAPAKRQHSSSHVRLNMSNTGSCRAHPRGSSRLDFCSERGYTALCTRAAGIRNPLTDCDESSAPKPDFFSLPLLLPSLPKRPILPAVIGGKAPDGVPALLTSGTLRQERLNITRLSSQNPADVTISRNGPTAFIILVFLAQSG